MRQTVSLIDGHAAADSTVPPRTIVSPFDGRPVTQVQPAEARLLERAIASAHAAREAMRRLPAHERARILEAIARRVADERDAFARMLEEEAGKPVTLGRVEADRCTQTFIDAAHWARQPFDEAIPLDGSPTGVNRQGIVKRFPIGVVAAITPFNFPLNLVAHKIGPAIAAGCPVVLKPASQTPSVAVRLAELAFEAGLPKNALHVVLLSGPDADPLVTDKRIAKITFTGSAEVGWGIKSRCGRKRITLELGGNAAAIVEPDADLDSAARKLATGAFAYAGQSCISVQRIYAHDSVAGPFIEALIAAAEKTNAGDPRDETVICGPLIDRPNADRVERWIADAVRRGAQVAYGNTRDGNVIRPTVVLNAPEDTDLCCSEIFGPVVTVSRYSHFDDALARVNHSRYGLQAGVYTNDVRKLWQAYETLEVGGVIHNDGPTFRIDAMPYGGVKESGMGREGARWAILKMTEPRLLVLSTR